MRLPGTARVGIFALFAGISVVGVGFYWANTRTLVPVDIPVTLASGHIQTGDFKINVKAYFSIQVRLPYDAGPGCGEASSLRTRRLSSIGGQLIAVPGWEEPTESGVTRGTYLGSFWSKPGLYNLDIEVFSSTQSLDHCRPRIQIEASYADFDKEESIQAYSFFFVWFVKLWE